MSSDPDAARGAPGGAPPRRSRRREQVLDAATELFRTHGFHAVGIDEIGAAAGISGPGVYRHFPNKHSLLVAIFDGVVGELHAGAQRILASSPTDGDALRALVAFHTDFALADRSIIAVYYQEERSLPESDRRRIRYGQRAYVDEWVKLVRRLRRGTGGPEALALVHAAIAVIASTTMYQSTLDRRRLHALLVDRAQQVLFNPRL